MSSPAGAVADSSTVFEVLGDERSRVLGTLHFTTVTKLLEAGSEAIGNGKAAVIDLAGIKDSDSSGLALLIEWLSVAKAARRTLRYENMPVQLKQLASLSDVEELLISSPAAPDVPPNEAGVKPQ